MDKIYTLTKHESDYPKLLLRDRDFERLRDLEREPDLERDLEDLRDERDLERDEREPDLERDLEPIYFNTSYYLEYYNCFNLIKIFSN